MPLTTTLPFDQIPHFSKRDKAYQMGDSNLRDFYEHEVDIEAFAQVIEQRQKFNTDRRLLKKVITTQYAHDTVGSTLQANLDDLDSEKTFTIITAHQPSLLTGPLYYIIKICSTISLCRRLTSHYQGYRFVPTFVSGGEDHDFEEIASLHFFNKTFTWATDQKGAVGRMNLDGIEEVLAQVTDTFGNLPHAQDLKDIIATAVSKSDNYGAFMRQLTHALFGHYGLMIVNMDEPIFKQAFLPYVLEDLDHEHSHRLVNKDQKALESVGYKSQAHAREVNIFVHKEDRLRIVKDQDSYAIGSTTYTKDALIDLLKDKPGDISPNVVLRPIYQELILPNLAYVGGGGELSYWMERTSLFSHWKIPFPMLVRRDSALIIESKESDNLVKLGMTVGDLFQREDHIIIDYTKSQSEEDLNLDIEKKEAQILFEKLLLRIEQVDASLKGAVKAEESKLIKAMDNIENKMIKAEKRKNEVQINRIKKLKNKLFPNNDSLQERYENFIPFYLKYGDTFISTLISSLDPLNKDFKIIELTLDD